MEPAVRRNSTASRESLPINRRLPVHVGCRESTAEAVLLSGVGFVHHTPALSIRQCAVSYDSQWLHNQRILCANSNCSYTPRKCCKPNFSFGASYDPETSSEVTQNNLHGAVHRAYLRQFFNIEWQDLAHKRRLHMMA
jgi:hypothetical protein